ncbi:MAG: Crp/Fnr family transcriptional regulator [Alloprevotella sp.]
MEHSFSNRLLYVPLFQGFSRLDFLDIVAQTPFDFRTLSPREVLFHQDSECRSLCIVLGGELQAVGESPDHSYKLAETLQAPWVVEPLSLFGLHNRYTRTYRAHTSLQVVMLSKQSVQQLLSTYAAFQINFYNMICTQGQACERAVWQQPASSLEQHFLQFLLSRSLRPVGQKQLYVRMTDLAVQLGTTRLNVSHMLARMSQAGRLSNTRGCISITL